MINFDRLEAAIHNYVTSEAALGIYDPATPRRVAIPVTSFTIEFCEVGDDFNAYAAGPVVLQTTNGAVKKFLRVSVTISADGNIPEGAEFRAAYIEETNPENGACKETAAFANA